MQKWANNSIKKQNQLCILTVETKLTRNHQYLCTNPILPSINIIVHHKVIQYRYVEIRKKYVTKILICLCERSTCFFEIAVSFVENTLADAVNFILLSYILCT